ncbi:MAG: alanine/glycine:cation symporter family protein [Lachnospiraceae bacterium]
MIDKIASINSSINGIVWGVPVLSLLILTGVLMTVLTKGFQFSHVAHWMKTTIGSIFDKNVSGKNEEKASISQFQALCTALAATVGVGNIAGVATAIVSGGPGAIFWMWIAALFGTMTNFSENVLGIYYRRKNVDGEWAGGAMYYLSDGVGSYKGCKQVGKVLAVLFSLFAIMASFGIGNASQVNTIASNMTSAFGIPSVLTGIVLMVLAGLVIVGGIKRIASVTEKVVPTMVVLYLVGALVVVLANASLIGSAFEAIFAFAFGFRALGGAAIGVAVKSAVTWGFKRGVFSNEAGLGSSVMVHSASNVKEPVRQGMWGIFEVFADTIVVCTLTALVILTSGCIDLTTGEMLTASEGSVLVSDAFAGVFGYAGSAFIAIAILLFAFSTVLGWSYYGTKAWEYLFGTKSTMLYKIVFVAFIFVGATMSLSLAWDISDTFNGLMAIPNLIGVLALSPLVIKITKNYVQRNLKGEDVAPILNADPQIQAEEAAALKNM